jgi:serine/threonine protein kinase
LICNLNFFIWYDSSIHGFEEVQEAKIDPEPVSEVDYYADQFKKKYALKGEALDEQHMQKMRSLIEAALKKLGSASDPSAVVTFTGDYGIDETYYAYKKIDKLENDKLVILTHELTGGKIKTLGQGTFGKVESLVKISSIGYSVLKGAYLSTIFKEVPAVHKRQYLKMANQSILDEKNTLDVLSDENRFSAMQKAPASLLKRWENAGSFLANAYVGKRYISDATKVVLTPEQVHIQATRLVSALLDMYKKGFVHGDIKPENMLVDKNNQIVLADLGGATALEDILDDKQPVFGVHTNDFVTVGDYEKLAEWESDDIQDAATLKSIQMNRDAFSLGLSLYFIAINQEKRNKEESDVLDLLDKEKVIELSLDYPVRYLNPGAFLTRVERDLQSKGMDADTISVIIGLVNPNPDERMSLEEAHSKLMENLPPVDIHDTNAQNAHLVAMNIFKNPAYLKDV